MGSRAELITLNLPFFVCSAFQLNTGSALWSVWACDPAECCPVFKPEEVGVVAAQVSAGWAVSLSHTPGCWGQAPHCAGWQTQAEAQRCGQEQLEHCPAWCHAPSLAAQIWDWRTGVTPKCWRWWHSPWKKTPRELKTLTILTVLRSLPLWCCCLLHECY